MLNLATLLPLLAGGGGQLDPAKLPDVPCAYCAAESADEPRLHGASLAEVRQVEHPPATLVAGTLVCRVHVPHALGALDRGHVAHQVEQLAQAAGLIAMELGRLRGADGA